MNDIKRIAYLYASMMDSDGKIATKELESWYQMVEKRWPEFQKEVAGNILKNTLYRIKSQNHLEKMNQIEKVLMELKDNLEKQDINDLAKDLSALIRSDGKISIGEMNLAGLLSWKLGLDINFN